MSKKKKCFYPEWYIQDVVNISKKKEKKEVKSNMIKGIDILNFLEEKKQKGVEGVEILIKNLKFIRDNKQVFY